MAAVNLGYRAPPPSCSFIVLATGRAHQSLRTGRPRSGRDQLQHEGAATVAAPSYAVPSPAPVAMVPRPAAPAVPPWSSVAPAAVQSLVVLSLVAGVSGLMAFF